MFLIKKREILYYNASMLLFPSRIEGFGFPLLEAMQAQIPVITSNCSCMPEIAKDAAIYLNNIDNSKEMSECIFEVERMDDTTRYTIIRSGLRRVEYFDAMNYSQLVLDVLHGNYRHDLF